MDEPKKHRAREDDGEAKDEKRMNGRGRDRERVRREEKRRGRTGGWMSRENE
jgi:hypothetical protein